MKRLLATAIVLCAASAARGQAARGAAAQQPVHPAVVRVVVPERDGTSYGSGALVAVNDMHGLVVTNWHVVRDVAGPITVLFPDGVSFGAKLLKIDRDWDLAALAIRRPNVQPIPLATQSPRPGELLTIAGYGKGWYRAASGQCTQYVSPGGNMPFEMVELAAPAREGDSGGPILNSRGELAGVLFGAAYGRTTGSYCGRVGWFLNGAMKDFQRLPPEAILIAQRPRPSAPPVATIAGHKAPPMTALTAPQRPAPAPATNTATNTANAPLSWPPAAGAPLTPAEPVIPSLPPATPPPDPNLTERVKVIFAGLGVVFLLFHGLRWLTWAAR